MGNSYIVVGLIALLTLGLILVASIEVEYTIKQYRLVSRWFGKKAANLYFILPPLIMLFIAALVLMMLHINGYKF
ncbi:MAG: hypothetical protein ABJB40_08065 [Acidobacteriota bacterium]